MSAQHQPERLISQVETFAIADTGDYDGNVNIRDASTLKLLATVYGCDDDEEAFGRRLTACWNACKGISTETLERSDLLSGINQRCRHLETQRDDLLTALRPFASTDLRTQGVHQRFVADVLRARTVIASVMGGLA